MPTKKYKITQLQQDNSLLELHPETDADIVNVGNSYGGNSTNVQDALEEVRLLAQNGGVTGVKGNNESSYRTGNVNITASNVGAVASETITNNSKINVDISSGHIDISNKALDSEISNRNGSIIIQERSGIRLAANTDMDQYNDWEAGTYATLRVSPTSIDVGHKLGNEAVESFDLLDLKDLAGYSVSSNISSSSTNEQLATALAVYRAIDNLPEPMVFKGTLGVGGTITSLPTASSLNEGFTYKVITAGTYASQSALIGDIFVSNGSSWVIIPSGDDVEDTWRTININGTQFKGNGISTGLINFKNGSNISISGSGNDITIAATDTTYSAGDGLTLNGTTFKVELDANGDSTMPVYIGDNGLPSICSSYAGGTKVTLNGIDRGATSTSIYAPTNPINTSTAKRYLIGSSSSTDVVTENTNTSCYMQNGILYSNDLAVYNKPSTGIPSSDLANSGVTAGTYSAVSVNNKGIVTAGAQMIEVGTSGQTTPSSSLAVGGIFFKQI